MAAVKPEKPEEQGHAASVSKVADAATVTDINQAKPVAGSNPVSPVGSTKASSHVGSTKTAMPGPIVINADAAANSSNAGSPKNVSPENGPAEAVDTANQNKNQTKRVVDEIVGLMGDVHDAKQELLARGIPFHTINVMVEFGVQGKLEEQAKMRDTALEASQNEHAGAAITAEKLDEHLENLVNLEKDLGHVRRLGRDSGLDMSSVNYLTMIIRQNPGDGGEKVVNTFIAYAKACDIPLDQLEEIFAEASAGPKSVLPDIPREEEGDLVTASRKQLFIDVLIGAALGALALSLLA